MSVQLFDSEGYAVAFADDDAVIEAGFDDLEYGDPENWPCWVDQYVFEPTEADSRWAAEHLELPPPWEPTDADLDEMAAWSEHLDRLEAMSREDDHEYECQVRFGGVG